MHLSKNYTVYKIAFLLLFIALIYLTFNYTNKPTFSHYGEMIAFHQRQNQQLPPNLIHFIGDSHIQGLAVQAIDLNSVNLGIGSDTTHGVLRRLDIYKSLDKAKAIFFAIGFNDLKSKKPDDVTKNIIRIINLLNAEKKIILNDVFPINESKTNLKNMNSRIINLNLGLKEICDNYINVFCLQVNPTFLGKNYSLKSDFDFGDGIHLNAKGYSIWINKIKSFFTLLGIS